MKKYIGIGICTGIILIMLGTIEQISKILFSVGLAIIITSLIYCAALFNST